MKRVIKGTTRGSGIGKKKRIGRTGSVKKLRTHGGRSGH